MKKEEGIIAMLELLDVGLIAFRSVAFITRPLGTSQALLCTAVVNINIVFSFSNTHLTLAVQAALLRVIKHKTKSVDGLGQRTMPNNNNKTIRC
ncbi:hypothetical protein VNO78_34313 [Psophocarpus tetragonolobus]|uniref:Uncharacterized protein n=1 Tax=Psophocarpus tetragonolobus TaxID=3891 RepID=A0AAN9P273_PSOTE